MHILKKQCDYLQGERMNGHVKNSHQKCDPEEFEPGNQDEEGCMFENKYVQSQTLSVSDTHACKCLIELHGGW